MNDKELIIKGINRIMPSASVDVLEFMYFLPFGVRSCQKGESCLNENC